MTESVVADRLSGFVREIATQADRSSSIVRTLDFAARVIPVCLTDMVKVSVSGSLILVHSSDPDRSALLIRAAKATGQSPAAWCRSAAVPTVIRDLNTDARWPRYARTASEATGLRSEMSIGLDGTEPGCLVLRFFSESPEAWSDADCLEAMAFAELAALAIDRVSLRESAANLRQALDSNRMIGAAVGIVMSRRRVSYDDAFAMIRVCSQNRNQRLGSVAHDVILSGDLPEPADGGLE